MIQKTCALALAAVALVWPVLAAADEGRPLTAVDLSGKTICWNGGTVETYYADGRTSDSRGHHTIWPVLEPGVVKYRIHYTPMLVLLDGRFQVHRWLGVSGGSLTSADIWYDHWGTVCK